MKLSIIVPVYNVENYIEDCLKSLIHQTIKSYEIIIVNDGSTDKSAEIIKRYQKEYPELIKYYKKENKGLSSARNYGITKATGEFIGFVDSDDKVEHNMFKEMIECAEKNNKDIVVCDYLKINNFGTEIKTLNILDDDSIKNIILKARPYACNKIFRKKLFDNIKFPEGLIFEDIFTVYSLMLTFNKIGYVNKPLYLYNFCRPDSIMKSKNRKDNNIFDILNLFNNYCQKNNLFKNNYDLIQEINVQHIFYRLNEMKQYNTKKENILFLNKSFSFLNDNFEKWKKNCDYIKKVHPLKKYRICWMLLVLTWRK